jgi:hypothetical protein
MLDGEGTPFGWGGIRSFWALRTRVVEGTGNMAMSIGKTTGHRLRSVDRLMATAVDLVARPTAHRSQTSAVPSRWLIERGPTRATAAVDVVGGFPGAVRAASLLTRTTLIISDHYLVVGEGTPYGFALPLADLLGAGVFRSATQATPGLTIRYREGDTVRTFGMQFRGVSRTLAGAWRAEEALRALAAQGVPVSDERRIAGPSRLSMSWQDARARGDEPVLWSGAATAAVGGWFGGRRNACRVWITDASLFWTCREGRGVNRLCLSEIAGVRVGPTATVLVATSDGLGHQYELPFVFANDDDLGAFLDALARVDIAATPAPASLTPWLRGLPAR